MQRRVLAAIMTVTTIVVLLFAMPLGFVIGRLLNERAVLALEHRADLAARSIDLTSAADAPDATEFPAGPEHFALYSPQGLLRTGVGPTRLEARMRTAQLGNTVTQHVGRQLVTAVPIVAGENLLGVVRVSRSLTAITRTTQRALALLTAGAFGVLLVGWLLAHRLADGISEATTGLRDAAIRLGGGDFTVDVSPTGIAELDDIAAAMSSTARGLDELVSREQSFSADSSHQLRTPVAGMRASLEAELAFPRPDPQDAIRESLVDLARLEQIITDLLTLARTKRTTNSVIDPFAIAVQARDHWSGIFARLGRPLTLHAPQTASTAYGHTALLRQAIDALLDNALTHGAGATTIDVRHDADTETNSVTIAIGDEGPGFSGERAPGPVPSTAMPATGASADGGLGLPLVRRLVHAQGGRLVIARERPHAIVQIVLRAPPTEVIRRTPRV